MQYETASGKALTAAPDATARGLSRCLACQHENKIGERLCEACGSSLNLKLCAACEAVNGDAAVTCYSCGAALGGAVISLVKAQATLAVPKARRLRARWALSLAVVLAFAVLTYQYFSQPAETAAVQSKESEGAQAKESEGAQVKESEGAQAKESKSAQAKESKGARARVTAPLSSGSAPLRDVAPDAAPSAAVGRSAGVAPTPKASQPQVRVTHTRPAETGASAAAPRPAVSAPLSSGSAPLRDVALDAATPAAAGQSAGVASTPKASRAHVRVTHTRPAEPGASAASPPPAVPAPAARERAPAAQCSEAIAALALCEIRDNRGGK
jgi:hypothetical protein